jgi:hypothetical protein
MTFFSEHGIMKCNCSAGIFYDVLVHHRKYASRPNALHINQGDCPESYCHDHGVSIGVTPQGKILTWAISFEPWGIGF